MEVPVPRITSTVESAEPSDAFDALAPYYDRLMRNVPYPSWVRYLERLFRVRNAHPKRVLDLACGTGAVSLILGARGYDVVGVDVSPAMIDQAKRKSPGISATVRFDVQDATDLNVAPPPFDVAISLFDSMNYILDPSKLMRAFAGVLRHLRPGGLFVFDINTVYALECAFFDQEDLAEDEPVRYSWKSTYDSTSRLCHVAMRFWIRGNGQEAELQETHVQRAYEVPAIVDMLGQTGFANIVTYHAYSLLPVRPTSDRVFFVAERPVG